MPVAPKRSTFMRSHPIFSKEFAGSESRSSLKLIAAWLPESEAVELYWAWLLSFLRVSWVVWDCRRPRFSSGALPEHWPAPFATQLANGPLQHLWPQPDFPCGRQSHGVISRTRPSRFPVTGIRLSIQM